MRPALALLLIGSVPLAVSAQTPPAPSQEAGSKTMFRYKQGRATEWVSCDPGEMLISAFCPSDGSHPFLRDQPGASESRQVTCRRGPFTVVCAR